MLNRIKNWNIKNINITQNNVVTLAMILSIMALVMSIPSSSNCVSADSCTVSSTGTFTGNMGIKSGTNYTLTQQHAYAQNVTANWQDVGGDHTGTVIMKDNAGDFNLNGGLRLGTSATSTNGTIRWNGSSVQVYNTGWANIGGSPTDDIGQVTADSGSFTAATQQDNINIVGGTGISTSITSDTLTINSSGGGIDYASYKLGSDQTLSYGGSSTVLDYDTEVFDTSGCFSTSSGTITYDAGCSSAYFMIENTQTFGFSGLSSGQAIIQGQIRKNGGDEFYYTNWFTLYGTNDSVTQTWNVPFCLDPSDTVDNEIWHGVGYASGSIVVKGGGNKGGFFTITKIKDKGSSC